MTSGMSIDLNKPDWLLQMEGIFETLNEGVCIVDDCGHIIFANERMLQMRGVSADEVLGRGPESFYAGDDLAHIRRQMALTQQQGHNRQEFYVPGSNGEKIPAIFSSRTIEDLEGRMFEIISFTDITAQKRAEAALKEANAQLQHRQDEIERELELAARVQQSLAPQGLRWGNFLVETLYQPVHTIGGDFGLVTPLGDGQLNLLVCDVSGHGISSALIANRIYSETMSLLERRADLGDMLRRLNAFVMQQIQTTSFYFSMAAARLDDRTRKMSFVNAGHPPAILVSRSGHSQLLEPRSAVLGILEDAVDPEPVQQLDLSPGDRVMLYTDGITEVFDKREELFGTPRLQQVARDTAHLPLPEMKHAILDKLAAWRHGPITDDMSIVLIEVY